MLKVYSNYHECGAQHLTSGYDSGGALLCRRCGYFFERRNYIFSIGRNSSRPKRADQICHARSNRGRICHARSSRGRIRYHVPKGAQVDQKVYGQTEDKLLVKSIIPCIGFYWIRRH